MALRLGWELGADWLLHEILASGSAAYAQGEEEFQMRRECFQLRP